MKPIPPGINPHVTFWAVAVLLVPAAPARAVITTQMDSANFTYQYNGDTLPNATTIGGWGNLGYDQSGGGSTLGLTFSTDGDILTTTPLQAATRLNFVDSVSQEWGANINDSTGHTWEISFRQKAYPDEWPAGFPNIDPAPISPELNRVFFRIGDGTDGVQAQLDMSTGDFNLIGDMGPISVGPGVTSDGLHVYRFAQEANDDTTDVWFDGEYQGAVPTDADFKTHQWGSVFDWSTAWEIDYVRFEVGGFAPMPLGVTDPADFNMDGYVDSLDLGVLLGNFGTATTPNMGELDGTPPVDSFDLGILLGAWDPMGGSALAAVPEPTALLLGAIASVGILMRVGKPRSLAPVTCGDPQARRL